MYTHSCFRLLIDWDHRKRPELGMIRARLRMLRLLPRSIRILRSSHHWHIVIELLYPLPHIAILFAQLFIGSDPGREAYNFHRVVHWKRTDRLINILFSKKGKLPCSTN